MGQTACRQAGIAASRWSTTSAVSMRRSPRFRSIKGKVRVHRVVCAVDCGQVVNPAIVVQQIESGIVYGLSAALRGEITIDRGRVQQTNFNNYEPLRIDEMPVIETYIVPSTNPPGGIGEASTPAIAPAVTNAIFSATGKRIRKLPIRPEDLT